MRGSLRPVPARPLMCLATLLGVCSADVLTPMSPRARALARDADPGRARSPTCPSTGGDSRALVPREAAAIVGIDATALRKSLWFPDLEAVGRAHPTVAMALAPIEGCGITVFDLREITIGLSDGKDAVAIVRAAGLGRPATIDCIAGELKATIGATPWTRRTTGCTSVLEIAGGEGRGFSIDDDTVVLATRGWTSAVADRVAGKGGAVPRGRHGEPGKLGWAWRHVDVSRTVWFAAEVSPRAAAMLGPHGSALRRVVGSIDAPAGLHVRVAFGFAGSAEARDAARALEAQLGRFRLAAPMFGIPGGVIDGIVATARGTRVEVTAAISETDLRALRRLLEGPGETASPAPGAGAGPGPI